MTDEDYRQQHIRMFSHESFLDCVRNSMDEYEDALKRRENGNLAASKFVDDCQRLLGYAKESKL